MTKSKLDEAEQLLLDAVAFAAEKHRHQRRKDAHASPYINHPIELAILLKREGISNPVTLCAALLHDTIEDTETTEEELRRAFGDRVADVVLEVTDDKLLPKHERKQRQIDHAHALSRKARAVKLADKICNLRDIIKSPPTGWPLQRRQEYFAWAKAVIDGLRGEHPHLEAIFDEVHRSGVQLLASEAQAAPAPAAAAGAPTTSDPVPRIEAVARAPAKKIARKTVLAARGTPGAGKHRKGRPAAKRRKPTSH